MQSVTLPWIVVGVGLWLFSHRTWAMLGFSISTGWRYWFAFTIVMLLTAYLGLAIVSIIRDAKSKATAREKIGELTDFVPHSTSEVVWFSGVSLTADFCEVFMYCEYSIWALTALLGWWGAVALSLALFAVGHLYQGWNGVIRTGLVGVFFTLVVAITDSLWSAIALHALLYLGQGVIAWLALRDKQNSNNMKSIGC